MRVDAPSLFNITNRLQVQAMRSRRLDRAPTVVEANDGLRDDIGSRRTDPETVGMLANWSRIRHALVSAIRTNRTIEDRFLFQEII